MKGLYLTIADNVEGACHSFAGRVVASTHAAFVPPGFRVQYMVTARLLLNNVVNGGINKKNMPAVI